MEKRIVSGHQPVYLPWLGLFHKIALADIFVFMDDVQYLTKDWNNRNKIKTPQATSWLIVPVSSKKSASNLLKDIVIDYSRYATKDDWQILHWKMIESNYKRSPFFSQYADFFHEMYTKMKWEKLCELNEYQLKYFLKVLRLNVEFHKASECGFEKKKSELVLEHCLRFGAQVCVTGCFGKDYIILEDFKAKGIDVYFQDYQHPTYPQLWGEFVSHLSVIDLLFNCGEESKNIFLKDNKTKKTLIEEMEAVSK